MKNVKDWKNQTQREKIIYAINNAKHKENWSSKRLFDDVLTQSDWNATLLTAINQANKNFGGNILIVSSEVNAILRSIMLYNPSNSKTTNGGDLYKSGTIGEFTVFVDVYLPSSILLIVKQDFFTSSNPDGVVVLVNGVYNV